MEFFVILLSTVLVNNFVLVQFLGLCPFMGVSNKLESAIGMSAATTFVLTLASICTYLVNTWVLNPLGLSFLRTVAFILVIAAVVQFAKMFIEKPARCSTASSASFCLLLRSTALCWAQPCKALTNPTVLPNPPSMVLARHWVSAWCWCCFPLCANGWPRRTYRCHSKAPQWA